MSRTSIRPTTTRALPEVAADVLAYLFYTSGSTGQPKGVSQTHRNLLFFVDAYAKALKIADADRVSLLYSLSFAASNQDIFGGLFNGATVCAYELRQERHPQSCRLARSRTDHRAACRSHRLSRARGEPRAGAPVTPSARHRSRRRSGVRKRCRTLPRAHAGALRPRQPSGGDGASVIAQHAIPHSSVYAPDAMIPVGRCPEGVRVEIRRDDGSPAERGEVGEMIVCSPHVSPGYWRRPDLNAKAFADDPRLPGWRRYFTNDFGHIDGEGNLHFLGRRGSRIKLRGQSIDLTEVEAALSACPGVTKVAVLVIAGERPSEPDRLVAYLVTGDEVDRDPLLIRRHAATRIPSYMCPTGYVFLDALPQTASGKVDRQALASMRPPEMDPVAEDRTSAGRHRTNGCRDLPATPRPDADRPGRRFFPAGRRFAGDGRAPGAAAHRVWR